MPDNIGDIVGECPMYAYEQEHIIEGPVWHEACAMLVCEFGSAAIPKHDALDIIEVALANAERRRHPKDVTGMLGFLLAAKHLAWTGIRKQSLRASPETVRRFRDRR